MDIQKFRPKTATPVATTTPKPTPKTTNSASSATSSEVLPPQPSSKIRPVKTKKLSKHAINRDAKEYFVENLSMLFATGVTVGDALSSVATEAPSTKVKKVIEAMMTKIDEGAPFWKALDETGILSGRL